MILRRSVHQKSSIENNGGYTKKRHNVNFIPIGVYIISTVLIAKDPQLFYILFSVRRFYCLLRQTANSTASNIDSTSRLIRQHQGSPFVFRPNPKANVILQHADICFL